MTTKKMHFVPQAYMRKFSAGDEKVHVLYKSKNYFHTPLGRPVSLNNICAENYLYSIAGPGQKNDAAVEDLFADIFDGNFNGLYEKLVNGSLVELSEMCLYEIMAWVASMYLRNRQLKSFLLVNLEQTFTERFDQAVIEGKQEFAYHNYRIPINGRTLEKLKASILKWDKSFLNRIMFPHIAETTLKWLSKSIVSLVTLSTDAEFITSDSPVTTQWSRDEHGVQNGGHIRCIPLDSKNLLKISPNHEGKNPMILHRIHVLPENQMAYALERNQIQMKLCTHFMIGSFQTLSGFQVQMKPVLEEIYGRI